MTIRKEALNCEAFAALKAVYDHRDEPARAFRAGGGRVVATLGCDVPEELILAAGMLPIRVYADPQRALVETDKYLEFAFDPVVRAQFEKLVDGTYAGLCDHLAVSNSTDVVVRIFLYLRELRRSHPEKPVPEVTFIDWLFTRNRMHQERNELVLDLFRKEVETWAGRAITDEEIRAAAALCNEDRAALREIQALRRGPQPRITGSEALVIIGASLFMEKGEHARLTRQVAEAAQAWPVLTGPRVFVTGSAQEDLELYTALEGAGAVVVGEDHDWGDRHYHRDTPVEQAPVRGLVDRYMLRQFSAKKAFVSQRVEALTADAAHAEAEGVLFYMNQFEEAGSWDYPSQKRALEAAGVATAAFVKQQYPVGKNKDLPGGVAAFVDGLKGGRG